jgi:hypothetical protein
MEQQERKCKLDGCENTFIPRVHNQTFCQRECCRIFTNARILAQYHEKKNRVMNGRICADCNTILSKYNDGKYCSVHEQARHIKKLRGWGWEVNEDGEILNK